MEELIRKYIKHLDYLKELQNTKTGNVRIKIDAEIDLLSIILTDLKTLENGTRNNLFSK